MECVDSAVWRHAGSVALLVSYDHSPPHELPSASLLDELIRALKHGLSESHARDLGDNPIVRWPYS